MGNRIGIHLKFYRLLRFSILLLELLGKFPLMMLKKKKPLREGSVKWDTILLPDDEERDQKRREGHFIDKIVIIKWPTSPF